MRKGKTGKRIISLALVLIMIFPIIPIAKTTVSADDTYSPVAVQTFNGHTYAVFDVAMAWNEAKAYCESLGGYLAVITTAEENAHVESLIMKGEKSNYWLGAADEAVEGDWRWINGEEWSFTHWAGGQPDNHT